MPNSLQGSQRTLDIGMKMGENMPKVLIVYFSKTGNTEAMARAVEKGVRSQGLEVVCKNVEEAHVDELPRFDGIIIGSPTYFGTVTAEIKKFIDDSIKHYKRLKGKVGGAFSSCGIVGGGGETTNLTILKALMIHGMIIQGTFDGGHYGPVAIRKPDEAKLAECEELGQRVSQLVKKTVS
jgi:NAD(P)H dehydrogenase (quinone)